MLVIYFRGTETSVVLQRPIAWKDSSHNDGEKINEDVEKDEKEMRRRESKKRECPRSVTAMHDNQNAHGRPRLVRISSATCS